MAKPNRKALQKKPVTQHQLFPAVVALWFGALFGLGSLAVRPSLLEDLVIKSRIDLLIPAAAPPLGMTARMLMALILAALGAMIGTVIARRIARPRPEARERKRANLSTRDEGSFARPYDDNAAVSVPGPCPAYDAGTRTDAAITAPGAPASRRRALAIEHEEGEFVPHELAPLPGGLPQIFDIAAAGLDDLPACEPIPAEPTGYGQLADPDAAPVAVALDWASAAPVLPPRAATAAPALAQATGLPQQPFQPAQPAAAEPGTSAAITEPAQPRPDDNRQVFGMAPPAQPPADQPRQIFGAPIADDHVSREFIEQHGFRTSVFDLPAPDPLFAPRPADGEAPAEAPVPVASEPAAEAVNAPAPADPPLPSPATLGIEDLSVRLAESMRRRRAARAAAANPATPAPGAPEALDAVEAAGPVPVFTEPPFVVPEPSGITAEAAAFTEPPSDPLPAALRPLDLSGFEEPGDNDPARLLPPRHIAMPAQPGPLPASPPIAESGPGPTPDEAEAAEEPAVDEENYASLLGIGAAAAPRNPFVRVEEPEATGETVEPVVIFPGQAAIASEAAQPFRRFDAPANAGSGQPVAAAGNTSPVPREEAELALRAALANLQRMSGAA